MRHRLAAAICAVMAASPAAASGAYPADTWEFILEFRRMPMTPVCIEKYGRGTIERTKSGRSPTYVLTGFPKASVIRCAFSNGGEFDIDAARFFDLPEDGFWKGTVELMGPGDIRRVRARYTYKIGPFVDGTFWFDTYKGEIKQSGGSIEMYQALANGTKH